MPRGVLYLTHPPRTAEPPRIAERLTHHPQEIGDENIFIFGAKAHEVARLRAERRNLHVDERFNHVVNMIRTGHFGWEDYFGPVVDAITTGGDYYLVANDFPGYLETQVGAGVGVLGGAGVLGWGSAVRRGRGRREGA